MKKLLLSSLFLMLFVSCNAEKAGEAVDEAASDAGQAVEETVNDIKDETCEMIDGKMECAAQEAGHAIEEAGNEVEDAVE